MLAWLGHISAFWKENKGLVLLAFLFLLFVTGSSIYFMTSEGWKSARAQKYLDRGNSLFSQGKMDEAAQVLEHFHDALPASPGAKRRAQFGGERQQQHLLPTAHRHANRSMRMRSCQSSAA